MQPLQFFWETSAADSSQAGFDPRVDPMCRTMAPSGRGKWIPRNLLKTTEEPLVNLGTFSTMKIIKHYIEPFLEEFRYMTAKPCYYFYPQTCLLNKKKRKAEMME